jgi:hypothetical protein
MHTPIVWSDQKASVLTELSCEDSVFEKDVIPRHSLGTTRRTDQLIISVKNKNPEVTSLGLLLDGGKRLISGRENISPMCGMDVVAFVQQLHYGGTEVLCRSGRPDKYAHLPPFSSATVVSGVL